MCRLRPLTFLASSQPRLALGTVSAARTDWESITAAVGSRSRPAAGRTWARSASCSPARVPSSRHRRSSHRRSARAGSRRAGPARRTGPDQVQDRVDDRPPRVCLRRPARRATRPAPAAAARSAATQHRSGQTGNRDERGQPGAGPGAEVGRVHPCAPAGSLRLIDTNGIIRSPPSSHGQHAGPTHRQAQNCSTTAHCSSQTLT